MRFTVALQELPESEMNPCLLITGEADFGTEVQSSSAVPSVPLLGPEQPPFYLDFAVVVRS